MSSADPQETHPSGRRPKHRVAATAVTAGLAAASVAAFITVGPPTDASVSPPAGSAASAAPGAVRADWTPAPAGPAGLKVLASAGASGFALHTGGGARDFIAGVDLGATTPGHQPGEVNYAITAEQYRRWFLQMGRLGIRAVRVYALHSPDFYRELRAYNLAHSKTPIYLVQGVYLTDESYVQDGTLYDRGVDQGFSDELIAASAALSGQLTRPEQAGRAYGSFDADVTPWLMSWLIGVEWDPEATVRTDKRHAGAAAVNGSYFRSTARATPTERWLARHMNTLAEAEAKRGRSLPIAFVNWPSTDPLAHPQEPHPGEDLVSVDANHVQATAAWPGGTFASYHAYPYYPDFLRYEPGLQKTTTNGKADPYAGYLAALKKHHKGMPVMITELGVPSSLGSAHSGPRGRDQGANTEQTAMTTDAELLRIVKAQGMAGAFLFSWSDEWFKLTWNTVEHQAPADRRQLWHDPLTNEQYFGIVAHDATPVPGARTEHPGTAGSGVSAVVTDADASYAYLTISYADGRPVRTGITADVVPGGVRPGQSGDYRITVDPVAGTATAEVREKLDPLRLDTWEKVPQTGKAWHTYRLITNRSWKDGQRMEVQEVGKLVQGTWQPDSARPNTLATWYTEGSTVHLRVPWAMLGIADPSSRTALIEGKETATTVVSGISLTVQTSAPNAKPMPVRLTWPTWDKNPGSSERLKLGASTLGKAFTDLND